MNVRDILSKVPVTCTTTPGLKTLSGCNVRILGRNPLGRYPIIGLIQPNYPLQSGPWVLTTWDDMGNSSDSPDRYAYNLVSEG